MRISAALDRLHLKIRQNRWMWYFTICCRLGLALGFLPSGFIKIMGERFTSLSANHPMGHYLEALHQTGYYYTSIGIMQVTAAILLLIPRTTIIGALLYLPIILNICILSLAVRFEGSFFTSPLMVLANLYLLYWDYDKLKFIFPFNPVISNRPKEKMSNRFPIFFFLGIVAIAATIVFIYQYAYDIKPRNTSADCLGQCEDNKNPQACINFCDCIHTKGNSLDSCLKEYNKALKAAKP